MGKGTDVYDLLSRAPRALTAYPSQQVERILAWTRVVLASGAVLAASGPLRVLADYPLAGPLVGAYLGCALAFLLLTARLPHRYSQLRIAGHVVDVICLPLICWLTGDPNAAFVVAFLFPTVTAAYRWGFIETFGTALCLVSLRWGPSALPASMPHVPAAVVSPQTVTGMSAALLVLGAVLGFVSEREKSFRFRLEVVNRLLPKSSVEASLRETITNALQAVRTLMSAERVLLAVQSRTGRAYLWELGQNTSGAPLGVRVARLPVAERGRYLFAAPAQSWHMTNQDRTRSGAFNCLAIGAGGTRMPAQAFGFSEAFFLAETFRSLFAVSFATEDGWSGRLFVLDATSEVNWFADLDFLQRLVREAVPSIFYGYRFRRLHCRLAAKERMRIAHELHDNLVQSLVGIAMGMEALRRRTVCEYPELEREILRLQGLLHREIQDTRSLMERLRERKVSPDQLTEMVTRVTSDFQRQTGILTTAECDSGTSELSTAVSGQIVSILHEALVNVRKHSGAQNLAVRLTRERDGWKLMVADDGRGFGFSGRLSQAELDRAAAGPLVIRERARSVGGFVEVESRPGEGSLVEVSFYPQALDARSDLSHATQHAPANELEAV